MKKLILSSIIFLSTLSYAEVSIGVRVQAPILGGVVDIGVRSDDHRYDSRYKNFNYDRYGYYDDFGYYFGYFDRTGYFFNNIFFLYDSRYSYYDRLHRRGYFRPTHVHYRPYKYHKVNNWNKTHQYREHNRPIYGHYYDKRKGNDKSKNSSRDYYYDEKKIPRR